MPQLDQLIATLFKHSADELLLTPGQQPALSVGGQQRPVVKNVLEPAHVTALVGEIAPPDRRAAIGGGQEFTFSYRCTDGAVEVTVSAGPRAVIRPGSTIAAVPVSPATAGASAQATAQVTPKRPTGGPLTMDTLLHTLIECEGSDLHLSSGCVPMMRVHGELTSIGGMPVLDKEATDNLLMSIAPQRNREEFKESGDTDFAYEITGLSRFRCNLFQDRKGPGGVYRAIPHEILTVDDLGLSKAIRDLCFLTKGLVVVTGPTGSGKSTTLAGLVDLINSKRKDHVITIEDPIEFVHPNKECLINQREVHVHTQGFKRALRAALREDPDVVLVGEMRDLETIHIALETAETGHLVFGTLHTSSAVSTVDRIIDQFPAGQQAQIRIMLSESLKAVIAQVLCRKVGGGRVAALETLIVNAAVSNLIREGKTFQIPSIMQTNKGSGMTTMNDALLEHVMQKRVEPEEAYLKAIDKTNLLSAFKAKRIPTHFLK